MPVNQSLETGGPAAGGEALGYFMLFHDNPRYAMTLEYTQRPSKTDRDYINIFHTLPRYCSIFIQRAPNPVEIQWQILPITPKLRSPLEKSYKRLPPRRCTWLFLWTHLFTKASNLIYLLQFSQNPMASPPNPLQTVKSFGNII